MELNQILNAVATSSGLSRDYILSDTRKHDSVFAKSAFMLIADSYNMYNQEVIEAFVNRKHGALNHAQKKADFEEVEELLRKTKILLTPKRQLTKKTLSTTEIVFLSSNSEIVMLTFKKYNNRVVIFDKQNNYKKIVDKKVSRFIVDYYMNNGRYERMPFSVLKKEKAKLNLPGVQCKMFNQYELEF